MSGKREVARAETTAGILAVAREQIAEHGGVGLSMRAVARGVDMVSSAVYRYFPTREALLTALIVESYGHLAEALDDGAEPPATPAARWRTLAGRLRAWAISHPHEFQLVYGTPIPTYVAPAETVPAAAAVARPFLEVAGEARVDGFTDPVLTSQFSDLTPPGGTAASAAAVVAELATLTGIVGLELAGHFTGLADPADAFYAAIVERQIDTLNLTS